MPAISKTTSFSSTIVIAIYLDEAYLCLKYEGGDPQVIEETQQYLKEGDDLREEGKFLYLWKDADTDIVEVKDARKRLEKLKKSLRPNTLQILIRIGCKQCRLRCL